jgi:hypothetical protein
VLLLAIISKMFQSLVPSVSQWNVVEIQGTGSVLFDPDVIFGFSGIHNLGEPYRQNSVFQSGPSIMWVH